MRVKLVLVLLIILISNTILSMCNDNTIAFDDEKELQRIYFQQQEKEAKELEEKYQIIENEIELISKVHFAINEIAYKNWCDYNTAYAVSNINTSKISCNTDLSNKRDITTDQMNYIIDSFLNGRESKLKDTGEYFIQASKQTGYDPIFLLCLSAQESGWLVSSLHSNKNNPYSLNMTDSNPHGGYVMGENYNEGIINGAIYINNHYYNRGKTTLRKMKGYCSTHESWERDIINMMNKAYKLLEEA